jgi:intein/homing endonuclease
VKEIRIPETITEDIAYLTGVLAGDGYLGYRPNKYEYVIDCGGNPEDEKEFYDNVLKPLFNNTFGIDVKPKLLSGGTYGFRFYSKQLFMYFTKEIGLPVSPKHPQIRIPDKIKMNLRLLKPFLQGVFDTDGSISFKGKYKSPSINFTQRTQKFLQDVEESLIKFGITSCKVQNQKVLDIRLQKGFSIRNTLWINGKKKLVIWEENIGFRNPKHLDKIEEWKNSGGKI